MTDRRRPALIAALFSLLAAASPLSAITEPGRRGATGGHSFPVERTSIPRLPNFLRQNLAQPPSAAAGPHAELEAAKAKSAGLRQDGRVTSDEEARAAAGQVLENQALVVSAAGAQEEAVPESAPSVPGRPRGPPRRYKAQEGLAPLLDRGVARGHLTPELARSIREVGYRDSLTGIPNRLFLDENLPALISGHRSLVSIKLDYLKELNDLYGHEVGNRAIRSAVALAQGFLGGQGLLIRRSPTKFDLFLDAPLADALKAAEALRAVTASQIGHIAALLNGERPSPVGLHPGTISLGVSELTPGDSPKEIYRAAFDAAERARRAAKDAGGDRVAVAGQSSPRLVARGSLEQASESLRGGRWEGLEGRLSALEGANLKAMLSRLPAQGLEPGKLLSQIDRHDLRGALWQIIYLNRQSGLPNRKWFWENLERLFGKPGFEHYLAIDIDHFGELNEQLGEEMMDLVLKELGPLLHAEQKTQDAQAVHLGGDEFAVMTGSLLPDPYAFAERLRLLIMRELGANAAHHRGILDPATGRPLSITVSIGVAKIDRGSASPRETFMRTVAAAEAMVQRAKDHGRNRVEPVPSDRD